MKKLTYLALKICLFGVYVTPDVQYSHKMSSLFKKFCSLLGLDFRKSAELPVCSACIASMSEMKWIWLFISYFPSLKYCYFTYSDSNSVQDIIAGCKKLEYLSCVTAEKLSLSSVCNSNLQQLSIYSPVTDIPEIFLETVSAHGGLSHIILFINSVTIEGITNLIVNSCELLALIVFTCHSICDKQGSKVNLKEFNTKMEKKFPCRKLFSVGSYKVRESECCSLGDYLDNTRHWGTEQYFFRY